MRKCIRCGEKNIPTYENKIICRSCQNDWRKMRSITYAYCEKTIGKMEGENFESFKKEMNKLENIWRRNRDRWYSIVFKEKT